MSQYVQTPWFQSYILKQTQTSDWGKGRKKQAYILNPKLTFLIVTYSICHIKGCGNLFKEFSLRIMHFKTFH